MNSFSYAVRLLLFISVAATSKGETIEETLKDCGYNASDVPHLLQPNEGGSGLGNESGSGGGSGGGDDAFNLTCAQISSILANSLRTAAPRIVVVVSSPVYPVASTPYIVVDATFSSEMPYPTSTAFLSKTATGLGSVTPTTMMTATPRRPVVPTPVLPSSTIRIKPTPTLLPTRFPTPPTVVTPSSFSERDVVRITLADITVTEWNERQNDVREAIANVATDHCKNNPTQCNLATSSVESSAVRFINKPYFNNQQQLVIDFVIALVNGAVLPAEQLIPSLNEEKAQIEIAAKAEILGFSEPRTEPTQGVAKTSSFPVAAVIGGVVGGLLVLILVVLAVWLGKRKRDSYNIVRVQPLGKDVERPNPEAPTVTQERQQKAWAKPPPQETSAAAAVPAADLTYHNPQLAVDPVRPASPLEDIPLREFSSDVAQRVEEEPGTVPKAHKGRASNPDIWPEARKAGRMASKTSLPPIGSQPM